jgi:hypothetical protein
MRLLTFVFVLALTAGVSAAGPRDLVARARVHYNHGQYDLAIATAREAMSRPEWKTQGSLVLARACLERYRQAHAPADLTTARGALDGLEMGRLGQTDRTELLVGWAELLYLSGQPGVAAEMFETAMARPDPGGVVMRERLVDWWAQALQLLAQGASDAGRQRVFGRMLARLEDEQHRYPDSAVVPYWIVVAARGVGDIDRAWNAAVSGWIRAPLTSGGGTTLRRDLDALMIDAVIPERARQATTNGDIRRTQDVLCAEWDTVKQAWRD